MFFLQSPFQPPGEGDIVSQKPSCNNVDQPGSKFAAMQTETGFCNATGKGLPDTNTSNFCRARAKLSEKARHELVVLVAKDTFRRGDRKDRLLAVGVDRLFLRTAATEIIET